MPRTKGAAKVPKALTPGQQSDALIDQILEAAKSKEEIEGPHDIYEALALVQEEFGSKPKEAGDILGKHGFMVYWADDVLGGVPVTTTVLRHIAFGQELRSSVSHKNGMLAGYANHLGLMGLLGIASNGSWITSDEAKLMHPIIVEEAKSPAPQKTSTLQQSAELTVEPDVKEKSLALDLKSLGVDKVLDMVKGCDLATQLEIVVNGVINGEAWLDIDDRALLIEAVRRRYNVMRNEKQERLRPFEKQMQTYCAELDDLLQKRDEDDRACAENDGK
jgi:hypothetical protein